MNRYTIVEHYFRSPYRISTKC